PVAERVRRPGSRRQRLYRVLFRGPRIAGQILLIDSQLSFLDSGRLYIHSQPASNVRVRGHSEGTHPGPRHSTVGRYSLSNLVLRVLELQDLPDAYTPRV